MNSSDDGLGELVGFVLAGVVALVLLGRRHPKLAALFAVLVLVWWGSADPEVMNLVGWALLGGAVVAAALGLWALLDRPSFRRRVSGPYRHRCRRAHYKCHWASLMAVHGLSWAPHPRHAAKGSGSIWELLAPRPPLPKLERVEAGVYQDRLWVRMLPGQTPGDFEAASEALAHALGARDLRVRVASPGRLLLEAAYSDPLADPVLPVRPGAQSDLRAIPVGCCEDGSDWQLPLAGSHVLLAGATGSGKSGLLYSLLHALSPEVATGRVRLLGIDPKGGMELLPARSLFGRLELNRFLGLDQAGAAIRTDILAQLVDLLSAALSDSARTPAARPPGHPALRFGRSESASPA